MASGKELLDKFKDRTDFDWSGWQGSTRSNRLINDAYKNAIDLTLDLPDNKKKLEMLRHLYIPSQVISSFTSNKALNSSFTSGVPYRIHTLKAKFIVNGKTYYFYAEPYFDKRGDTLNEASVRFPKYDIAGNLDSSGYVQIYPSTTVSEIDVSYFKIPTDIDTTSTTNLYFHPDFDDLIVSSAIKLFANSQQDVYQTQTAAANQSERLS